jgi:AcrR family transcriptional regulator
MSDKRSSIILAAFELFCENGFQNTTTANISKKAGVATGTLFLYFKSKDELIDELYKEAKGDLAVCMQKDLPVKGSIYEKMKHILVNTILWGMHQPYYFRFTHMYGLSPYISEKTKQETMANFAFAFSLLQEGIRKKMIINMEVDFLIQILNGHLNVIINYLHTNNKQKPSKKFLDNAFEILWKGISMDGSRTK